MITLVYSPKQHLPKDMQHSVHISKDLFDILYQGDNWQVVKQFVFDKSGFFQFGLITKIKGTPNESPNIGLFRL